MEVGGGRLLQGHSSRSVNDGGGRGPATAGSQFKVSESGVRRGRLL